MVYSLGSLCSFLSFISSHFISSHCASSCLIQIPLNISILSIITICFSFCLQPRFNYTHMHMHTSGCCILWYRINSNSHKMIVLFWTFWLLVFFLLRLFQKKCVSDNLVFFTYNVMTKYNSVIHWNIIFCTYNNKKVVCLGLSFYFTIRAHRVQCSYPAHWITLLFTCTTSAFCIRLLYV